MADDQPTTADAQTGDADITPVPEAGAGDSTAGSPTGPDGEPFDADRAMNTIKTLREAEKAGKAAAKERDELAARLKKLEDAQKTEDEKRQERLAALEAEKAGWATERQELLLQREVLGKAHELGVADAELALAALDRSAIEFDDEGRPTNVEDTLTALLEAKPILKAQGMPDPPPPTGDLDSGAGRNDAPPPTLTTDEAAMAEATGMDPRRYEAMKGVQTLDQYLAATGSNKAASGDTG